MGFSDFSKYAGLSSFNPLKWHGRDWLTAGLGAATGGIFGPAAAGFGPGAVGAGAGIGSQAASAATGALKNQFGGLTKAAQPLMGALGAASSAASSPAGGAMMAALAQAIENQNRQNMLNARLGEVAAGFESPENASRLNQMLRDIYETTRERGDVQSIAGLGDALRAIRQKGAATGAAGGSVGKTMGAQAKANFLGNRQQSALEATAQRQNASDALANLRRSMESAVRQGQWAPSGSDVFQQQASTLRTAAAGIPGNVAGSIVAEQVAPTALDLGLRSLAGRRKAAPITQGAGGY